MTNTITTSEQIDALPAGQWVIDADGHNACLFDTHMGFPQRMWGFKTNYGTSGKIHSYSHLENLTLPAHLADIDGDFKCPHTDSNECGQCIICGAPGVAEARPAYFVPFDESGELKPSDLELFRRANPSIYPGHQELRVPLEMWPKELTVGELVAELLKLPQDAKIFRADSEYGPEAVTGVDVDPERFGFPERIVIS